MKQTELESLGPYPRQPSTGDVTALGVLFIVIALGVWVFHEQSLSRWNSTQIKQVEHTLHEHIERCEK